MDHTDCLRTQDHESGLNNREELFNQYKPLALGMVHQRYKFALHWIPVEDLEQDACAGLWKAFSRYDAGKGVPFEAYARYWIKDAIFSNPANQRMSRRWLRHYRKVIQVHDHLMYALQRKPTVEEIAQSTGLKIGQVEQALQAVEYGFPASLETLQDDPEQRGEWEPAAPATDHELWLDVKDAIRQLSRREQKLIELTYFQGMSDFDAGVALGLLPDGDTWVDEAALRDKVEDHVQQIRCRALKSLRRLLARDGNQSSSSGEGSNP